MLERVRRFLDVRPGEGLPVLLTFFYIAVVVASLLLAKPIRQGLVLRTYGPYALVYLYAAVPLVLTLIVPVYTRLAVRAGLRAVTVGTLVFFSLNAVAFWAAVRFAPAPLLPAVFFVWVNCYAVIAPVQAWSFASSLFDTRQAKRLFGLVGSGASLGAITGGVLARFLVEPVGGTVNLMLVLAVMLLAAAAIVLAAGPRVRRAEPVRRGPAERRRLAGAFGEIASSRYLRLMAGLVFTSAIATQWTAFQLNVVAELRFGDDLDRLTQFFGTFNFVLGSVSFLVQILLTGRLLRGAGLTATILALPLALLAGDLLILAAPVFWAVLVTNACDQSLRFSVDKASYELLYLPIPASRRLHVKNAIDIMVTRVADGVGAVALGLITAGFVVPGLELGVRGIAAVNLAALSAWFVFAWQVRREYVRAIEESIHRHRMDLERGAPAVTERTAAAVLAQRLSGGTETDILYALQMIEGQQARRWLPSLRNLLGHPDAEIRRRSLALLATAGDDAIEDRARQLLRDQDLGVRTEALLYLTREGGVDPLRQIEELGQFEAHSIRAGAAAFLLSPGPARNVEAARAILEGMIASAGADGRPDRMEAARVIGALAGVDLDDLLRTLVQDEDGDVAREAIAAAGKRRRVSLAPLLIDALGRAELTDAAGTALAEIGGPAVPPAAAALKDDGVPAAVRRELPAVLLRIGTAGAERALVSSLLQADATVRHRVIASLNKLRASHPAVRLDPAVVELLLAAEIAGHYRSHQVLGPLRPRLAPDDPVLLALHASMDQEIERIFRLMALLLPQSGLHDAYVGVRSTNPAVRANALEFLENVLAPELRNVLLPLLDGQVSIDERIRLADRFVGAPRESAEPAVATLLASEDPWLRSCAIAAVGTLRLDSLEPELRRLARSGDPFVVEALAAARARLAEEESSAEESTLATPADLNAGVGAG